MIKEYKKKCCKLYFWNNLKVKKIKHKCTEMSGTEEVVFFVDNF